MKNKKVMIAMLAVMLLASLVLTACAPKAQEGIKAVTVEVVHGNGTKVIKNYQTDKNYLSELLLEEGLIESGGADDGMYNIVDGEEAKWDPDQAYWGFYINGEYAMYGMDDTALEDGAVYTLKYESSAPVQDTTKETKASPDAA